MKTIYLTAGTEYVQFDELADRIASALHPLNDSATDIEMMAYGGAHINLEAELLQAAKSGALPVKDPLTFGPHSFPFGHALKKSLVSVSDLRVFLAGRPIAIESGPAKTAATPASAGALGASGGTGTTWTVERKEAARAMINEQRGKGTKAFAANTAAAFGVTATRLREVLNDRPNKAPAKKRKGIWGV